MNPYDFAVRWLLISSCGLFLAAVANDAWERRAPRRDRRTR